MNLIERAKAPIPKFFRILRSVGLAMLVISGSVIAAPVTLPVAVVSVAGYVAVAGGVISAVSQMTVSPLTPEGGIKVEPLDRAQDKENSNKARDGD
jgi:uncharacterized membrane protein YeiH